MAAEPLVLVTEVEPAETATFTVGQAVRFHLFVCDAETMVAVDPDTVALTVTPPYAASTTPTPVKDDVGVYHSDIVFTAVGKWRARYLTSYSAVNYGSNIGEFIVV